MNFTFDLQNEHQLKTYEELRTANKELIPAVLKGEAQYEDSLGWLDIDKWANQDALQEMITQAKRVRENGEVFLFIGVGGSNNAGRSVIEALQKENDSIEIIYVGNTLSGPQLNKILRKIKGKSVYLNCIAKNFETLEPGYAFRVFRQFLEEKYGKQAHERIFITGSKGSTLEALGEKEGYTFFEFPEDIGGRYSGLSAVNLFPMAVAGIDITALVKGAKMTREALNKDLTTDNIAYRYACYRMACYQEGKKVEMLSFFEPQFHWFKNWWIQLFAESEGKENQGIFPVAAEFSEELHSVGQFIQDGSPIIFETFLNVLHPGEDYTIQKDDKKDYFEYLDNQGMNEINHAAYVATYEAHQEKLPVAHFDVESITPETFGSLFYLFAVSCYFSCRILGVNPFNQPGVEAYKNLMFKQLRKNENLKSF